MTRCKVHVSIPGTYEGIVVWVDAEDEAAAEQSIARLLAVSRANPRAEPEIRVS